MLDDLVLIWNWVMTQFDNIWVLYSSATVLVFPLVLWVLDRLFRIFDVIKR